MKNKKSLFVLAAAMLVGTFAASTLTSCGGGDEPGASSSSVEEAVHVETITLTSSVSYLNVGATTRLGLRVSPSDATDPSVTYASSNTSIASVDASGVVTGVAEGTATITATSNDGGKTSSVTLQILKEGYEMLGVNELSEALMATPYQSKVVGTDKFGLSSPDIVGVSEAEAGAAHYLPKADSEYDTVIDAGSLTLAQIKEVLPEATEVNGYTMIQGAILLAKKESDTNKSSKIKLPAGNIVVDTTNVTSGRAFVLEGLKHVAIEGNNTVIVIKINELAFKGYMTISNCEDLTLAGIRFTQEVSANVTGTVRSYDVEKYTATIEIDPAYNETMRRVVEKNAHLRSYLEFHRTTKAPIQGGNFAVDSFSGVTYEKTASGYTAIVKFQQAINASQIGTLASLQYTQYDASGIAIGSSKDVYLESITMNKAYGMGLTADRVENLFVNRFHLEVEEGSKDLMTSTADALHFSMLSGKTEVKNCLIEYSHDDALNIKHGYWYKVDSANSRERSFTFSRLTSSMPLPKVGDKISIYNETSFEGHGTYTVASASEASGKMTVVVEERINNFNTWGPCRVTFLANAPEFVFANNIVRFKRNRGILVQVPNAIIENNTFQNVGHGSIQAASSMDIYNEATLPQGLVIRNNKFISNNYLRDGTLQGDVSIFAIANNGTVGPSGTLKDAVLENNFFADNGNAAVSMRGVGDSVVKDTLFYNASSSQPSGDVYKCLFNFYNTGNVTIKDSHNQDNLNNGVCGIIPQGTTSADNTTLDNNKNIAFQVIDDIGPEVNIKKATGEITVDGSLADWDAIGATDIELRGYTDALGAEHTPATLESTFKVNSLKMTWTDKGIYLAADVFDDTPDYKTINDFWLGDCIEILASNILNKPNADLNVYREDGGVIQAAFAPTWTDSNCSTLGAVRTNSKYLPNANLLQTSFETSATGYKAEILFPFEFMTDWKESIDKEERIAMAIVIADSERPSRKRIQASNVPHNVENNKTMTARMPRYLFEK